ncbi:hypothetical protein [Aliihoeflea sp. 40Bstr573]|uniref:hypothetical protein n=1 Tax=Aliihoeflea sp. 40Bstr573 TaxID=2696467 RepID=UPI00209515B2|nr:hypothetical protein [Aliihoeflea sp. 40Bstr573]MCO6388994.1 hypothetical protein [Aliihoeflea sp. 40Bstr573]
MARFADRFRRGEPTPERAVERAPASLLSVEPAIEPEPLAENNEMPAETLPGELAADMRPALLRKLSGEHVEPKRWFGQLLSGKGDDTILAAAPQRSRKPRHRIGGWMARLTGEDRLQEAAAHDEIDEDAFEDIRRQIDSAGSEPDNDLQDAEKRLTLALSKAGWLAEEIAKCNAALDDARRQIRDEELRLARLRGLHDGIGERTGAGQADLDAIQDTLDTLRRMVDRLEPR